MAGETLTIGYLVVIITWNGCGCNGTVCMWRDHWWVMLFESIWIWNRILVGAICWIALAVVGASFFELKWLLLAEATGRLILGFQLCTVPVQLLQPKLAQTWSAEQPQGREGIIHGGLVVDTYRNAEIRIQEAQVAGVGLERHTWNE